MRPFETSGCCQELPGEQLFGYVDESDAPHAIDSGDVNDYLREVAGERQGHRRHRARLSAPRANHLVTQIHLPVRIALGRLFREINK